MRCTARRSTSALEVTKIVPIPRRSRLPPHRKAAQTALWTENIFRALSARVANRWRFVSFRGTANGEWRGIVDLVAIRKDTSQPALAPLKRGDLFDIVLVQIKGGAARPPNLSERKRLRIVANR